MVMAWVMSAQADPLSGFGVVRPKVNKPAPAFSLVGLDGLRHRLSDYRGKAVILHFWATWCTACRHEMPQLAALQKQHESDLAVVGINVDRGNRAGVVRFMEQIHVDFPCLLDATGEVRNRYHIRALPTSYLIGRDGRFVGRMIGGRDWRSPAAGKLIDDLMHPKEVNDDE